MRGAGRFTLAQGLVATVQGIGASASGLISGVIVDHAGYNAGFLSLGAAAAIAVTVFGLAMPETAPRYAIDSSATPESDRLLAERG